MEYTSMRGTFGIVIILLVLLSPTYPLQAQGIRAGGSASRGISGGIRGARVGTTGSGRQGMVSNFRPGFSQAAPASSFQGNSVGIGRGMANSRIGQRGFGQNISNLGASFGSSSNLTSSTLGKGISNQQSRLISAYRKNTMAPVYQGSPGFDYGRLNKIRPRTQNDRLQSEKGRNYPPNNSGNISRGLTNPLIIDKRASLISKRLNSIRNENPQRTFTGKEGAVKPLNEISIASAENRNIVRWIDRNNGIRHYTNDMRSVPEGAKTITLADGKNPTLGSRSSAGAINFRNSQFLLREASLKSPDRTANLVMEKTVDFPGHRRGFATAQNRVNSGIQNAHDSKRFDGGKGFHGHDRNDFRHHDFHHSRFFPLDPFIFNNSFFFISPVFPVSSFFFNPFVFQSPAIFPSPFIGFQPFFVPAAPVVFIPVFPQFTTFTPFIDPFLLNPFFSPFLFGTNFFSTSIAFNNFF
jgi:hypothetical protein